LAYLRITTKLGRIYPGASLQRPIVAADHYHQAHRIRVIVELQNIDITKLYTTPERMAGRSENWPSFDALPLDPSGPPGNSWGLWGKDDELGMLNHLTPETTKRATEEVVHGIRIPLDHPLDKFNMPAFGRQPFHQEIRLKSPRTVNDDVLTFNTQSSSQWDGLRHYGR
jgi:hypothetical protein